MSQVIEGWRVPDGVDLPDPPAPDVWDRLKDGNGNAYYYLKADGVVMVGKQCGLLRINPGDNPPEIITASDQDDIPYVAVRATVEFEDEGVISDIGSTDVGSNGLEHMVSTAATRAVRKAITRHLSIARVETASGGDSGGGSGGSVERGPDGPVVNPPPEYESDDSSGNQPSDVGGESEW